MARVFGAGRRRHQPRVITHSAAVSACEARGELWCAVGQPRKARSEVSAYSVGVIAYSVEVSAYSVEVSAYSGEVIAYSVEVIAYSVEVSAHSVEVSAYSVEVIAYSVEVGAYSVEVGAHSVEVVACSCTARCLQWGSRRPVPLRRRSRRCGRVLRRA